MHFSNIVVASLSFAGLSLASAVDRKAILTSSKNKWAKGTQISFPGDPFFSTATERWTVYRPPTYWAAVSPVNEDDVAKVVSWPIFSLNTFEPFN